MDEWKVVGLGRSVWLDLGQTGCVYCAKDESAYVREFSTVWGEIEVYGVFGECWDCCCIQVSLETRFRSDFWIEIRKFDESHIDFDGYRDNAWLWTDGRYWLQAENELGIGDSKFCG